jgi:hypothetical protein
VRGGIVQVARDPRALLGSLRAGLTSRADVELS